MLGRNMNRGFESNSSDLFICSGKVADPSAKTASPKMTVPKMDQRRVNHLLDLLHPSGKE